MLKGTSRGYDIAFLANIILDLKDLPGTNTLSFHKQL
jgi:hypothetical protein